MNESSVVVYDGNIIDSQIGTPVSVDFDFDKIWEIRKLIDFSTSKLDFYHVHPSGFTQYSMQDEKVMKGYAIALGEPIFFHIAIFEPHFEINSWLVWQKEYIPIKCDHLIEVIELLKNMSYPKGELT